MKAQEINYVRRKRCPREFPGRIGEDNRIKKNVVEEITKPGRVDQNEQGEQAKAEPGQASPAEAVRSWMQSRTHRSNIVSPAFTELGVGYAIDGGGRPYYVQVFANPASS